MTLPVRLYRQIFIWNIYFFDLRLKTRLRMPFNLIALHIRHNCSLHISFCAGAHLPKYTVCYSWQGAYSWFAIHQEEQPLKSSFLINCAAQGWKWCQESWRPLPCLSMDAFHLPCRVLKTTFYGTLVAKRITWTWLYCQSVLRSITKSLTWYHP